MTFAIKGFGAKILKTMEPNGREPIGNARQETNETAAAGGMPSPTNGQPSSSGARAPVPGQRYRRNLGPGTASHKEIQRENQHRHVCGVLVREGIDAHEASALFDQKISPAEFLNLLNKSKGFTARVVYDLLKRYTKEDVLKFRDGGYTPESLMKAAGSSRPVGSAQSLSAALEKSTSALDALTIDDVKAKFIANSEAKGHTKADLDKLELSLAGWMRGDPGATFMQEAAASLGFEAGTSQQAVNLLPAEQKPILAEGATKALKALKEQLKIKSNSVRFSVNELADPKSSSPKMEIGINAAHTEFSIPTRRQPLSWRGGNTFTAQDVVDLLPVDGSMDLRRLAKSLREHFEENSTDQYFFDNARLIFKITPFESRTDLKKYLTEDKRNIFLSGVERAITAQNGAVDFEPSDAFASNQESNQTKFLTGIRKASQRREVTATEEVEEEYEEKFVDNFSRLLKSLDKSDFEQVLKAVYFDTSGPMKNYMPELFKSVNDDFGHIFRADFFGALSAENIESYSNLTDQARNYEPTPLNMSNIGAPTSYESTKPVPAKSAMKSTSSPSIQKNLRFNPSVTQSNGGNDLTLKDALNNKI